MATPRIRMLTEHAEFRRCVDFQHAIWGDDFGEVVPPAALWVATRTGGIVAGAFDDDDVMIGFLFGITGFVAGAPTHWSDMLAVLPRARGRGLGQALKRFQRDTLLARGVHHVAWTFDPLESRNAHLNFACLGITAREYILDCYGDSRSPLHAGLPTDRLVADWLLSSPRVRSRMESRVPPPRRAELAGTPIINAQMEPDLSLTGPRLLLRIPTNIQELKHQDLAAARAWRAAVRAAFTTYFARGYEAMELLRAGEEGSYYLLEAAPSLTRQPTAP